MQQPRLLESRTLHQVLAAFGCLLLLLALLQLPLSVFLQNTRPALPFVITKMDRAGLVVAPSPLAHLAKHSAIKDRDIITAIDGVQVDSASLEALTFSDMMVAMHVYDTLHIELLREGQRETVDVVLLQTRAEALGPVVSYTLYIINAVAPLVIMLIALVVLFRRPRIRTSSLYFLLSAAISVYLLTSSVLTMSIPWWAALRLGTSVLSTAAFIFFVPLLLHFLLLFPEERRLRGSERLRNAMVYAPFLGLLAYEMVLTFVKGSEPAMSVVAALNYAFFVFGPLVGVGVLISSYRRAQSNITRKVIRIVLTGIVLFALSVAVSVSISMYSSEWDIPLAALVYIRVISSGIGVLALPLCFGFAILRYGFLDVRVIFKRSTVYAILASFVALFFVLVYILLQAFIETFSRTEVLFVSVIVTGVLAVAVSMLKDRIQQFVDKRLFREEYRVATGLRALSRSLVNMLNRDDLLRALTVELPSLLGVRSASVLGLDDAGEAVHLAGDRIEPEPLRPLTSHPRFRAAMSDGDVLVVNGLPGIAYRPDLNAAFPIASHDNETVTVVLGERRDGKPLSSDEVALLRTVADHATLGWKNARLTEEMKEQERIKREIEIAHTIQAAMLPLQTPSLSGVEIAAVSTPAREVGGDFFDFVRTADGNTALVLGDVADKGISAAMVMASSISTLRYAAEQDSSPARILARANSRLFLDTHKHMFVAVFFGVLDMEASELRFTNAGLPKPLLLRDGESYLIEWSDNGNHYPLGTQAQVQYHEQSLPVQPGDILVLYTDGVVESSNVNDEEYGVKRLRDTVRATAQLSAEDIKRLVCEDVALFSGRSELFDDLTLMIVKFTSLTE
jgi:serine phosphatase RsbU (regulator of sigma subunit)